MRDEYVPDQPANNKDHRNGNEYLLQYFHIFLHIKIIRMTTAMRPLQISGIWPRNLTMVTRESPGYHNRKICRSRLL